MKCEYCGTDEKSGEKCSKCGAKLPVKINSEASAKSEPFFYNGYIIYLLRDCASDALEAQFWLGLELIQRISVSREVIRLHVPEGEDIMPFFWDLFCLADNKIDVIEYQEKNTKYPAKFLITRHENEEISRLRNLSLREIALEAAHVAR